MYHYVQPMHPYRALITLQHLAFCSVPTLQGAYDVPATAADSIIRLLEGSGCVSCTASRKLAVTLEGGYDASYGAPGSDSSIQVPQLIRQGTVHVRGIKLR